MTDIPTQSSSDSRKSPALPKIGVVVPCYNESRRLKPKVLLEFVERMPSIQLLLVDDDSTDDTATVLHHLSEQHSRIEHLILSSNRGKAESVRTGICHLLDSPTKNLELVGYWDADLACPLDEIKHFLTEDTVDSKQIWMGCRLQRLGAHVKKPMFRHYISRILATVFSEMLGLRVYDTQCGAKLFKSTCAKVLFVEPFLATWIFDVEILFRAIQHYGRTWVEANVVEVPVYTWVDQKESKMRLRYFPKLIGEMWKLLRHYHRKSRGSNHEG